MNKILCSLAGLSLLLLSCTPEKGPKEVPAYALEDFLASTSYSGGNFSPDKKKILVSTNETGIFNAAMIDIASGQQVALTASDSNSIFVVAYFPKDERFLFSSDQGGNELNHLYVQDEKGEVTDLTPGEKLKAGFAGWAEDKRSFFVMSNERDPRFMDVYEYMVHDYSRSMFFQNDSAYNIGAISPDKTWIALGLTRGNAKSDMFLHHRPRGITDKIHEDAGDVQYRPQTFSKDGMYLYYLSDRDDEFQYLERMNMESREKEKVYEEEWDLTYAAYSPKGSYMLVGVNEDAQSRVRVFDAATMEKVDIKGLPDGNITGLGFADDETQYLCRVGAGNRPGDIFYGDGTSAARALTQSLNKNIDPENLVAGEVKRFDSFDGVEIPGILYMPHQASEANKVPAVVWVHGGPGGQSRIGYNWNIQYLVNSGYAVYAINNRGSSGYGKTFYHLDDRNHGKDDLDDCVESKKMLVATGKVNPDQIAILGGSYGGFMTLAALTFRPEAFDAGVDLFGISNWWRTVNSIPPWWESFRKYLEQEMGDFNDSAYFKSISPIFHYDNITRPLMVLQGANDPRVLKVESDEIVEAVKAKGIPCEYVVFDDEGHGFVKKENQKVAWKGIKAFLDQYVKKEAPKETAALP
ncbi:MAG: S9 family peptidase [Bacteroidota bacterium]